MKHLRFQVGNQHDLKTGIAYDNLSDLKRRKGFRCFKIIFTKNNK